MTLHHHQHEGNHRNAIKELNMIGGHQGLLSSFVLWRWSVFDLVEADASKVLCARDIIWSLTGLGAMPGLQVVFTDCPPQVVGDKLVHSTGVQHGFVAPVIVDYITQVLFVSLSKGCE